MFEDALDYPRRGDDTVTTVLIGGLLTLFSVFLVPLVPLLGYFQRVFRQTAADDDLPPVFDDWEGLLGDGLRATVVFVGYFLLPILLGVVGLIVAVISVSAFTVSEAVETSTVVDATTSTVVTEATTGTTAGAALGGGLFVLFVLAVGLFLVVWSLAAAYLLPAGLARLAATDRVGAAFALRDVWQTAATTGYATGWLAALAVSVAAGVVMGAVAAVPFVGPVAAAFVYFYATVVSVRLYAVGVASATPVEAADGETTSPTA